MARKERNLVGLRQYKLLVLRELPSRDGNRYWECQCDCGKIKTYSTEALMSGRKSCGCATREATIARSTKHGYSKRGDSRLTNIHSKMIARCENPKSNVYYNYGARGIRVCEEWHDLKTFGDWAVANGYSKELTLDRIDSNGNYEPSNCRWVSWDIQANNTRHNHIIETELGSMTVTKALKLFNIPRTTFYRNAKKGLVGMELIKKCMEARRNG